MNEIIIKVASKGEGKTRWLLSMAKNAINDGKNVVYYTDNEIDYNRFCSKYMNLYNQTCPVKMVGCHRGVDSNTVVLIDDVFENTSMVSEIQIIRAKCDTLYITIEGKLAQNDTTVVGEYEQITMEI